MATAAAAVAAPRTCCATQGCGRLFLSNGHSHCCSACRHTMSQHHTRRCDSHQLGTDARGRVTICNIPGCGHLAGLGHVTCCRRCVTTQGRRHTRRCYNANFGNPAVAIFLGAQGRWEDRAATTMPTTSSSSSTTAGAGHTTGSCPSRHPSSTLASAFAAPGAQDTHSLDHGEASTVLPPTQGETEAEDTAAAAVGDAMTSDSASATFCEDVDMQVAVMISLDSLD